MGPPLRRLRHLATRVRTHLQRMSAKRPWLYWSLVASAAAFVWGSLDARTGEIDAARDRWGASVEVLVAAAPIAPGQPIAPLVELRRVPIEVAPPSALATSSDEVARRSVDVGEIIAAADVAMVDGPLALAPSGWVAVAITETPPSGATIGDSVMVVSEGIVVAEDAMVISVSSQATLVAMPEPAAPAAAHAVQNQRVSLVLSSRPVD